MENLMLTTDLLDKISSDISNFGFCHLKDYLIDSDRSGIAREIDLIEEEYYSKDNLLNRAVYQSDKSESRKSYAVMASVIKSKELPSVDLSSGLVKKHLMYFNSILSCLTGEVVGEDSRSLINFQSYFGESKPVPEHFDGDILDASNGDNYNLVIHQALLPRYVMVIVVENDNTEGDTGTVLRRVSTGETYSPNLKSGDAIIFDNLEFRHSVPKLKNKRKMFGFRNFDSGSYLFMGGKNLSKFESLPEGWSKIEDRSNPGYITKLTQKDSNLISKYFNKFEWPTKRSKWLSDNGIF